MKKRRELFHIGFCLFLAVFLSSSSFAGEKGIFTPHYSIFNHKGDYNYKSPITAPYMAAVNNMGKQLGRDLERPKLSKGKIVGEVLAGMAGNVAFGAAGGYIGLQVWSKSEDRGGEYWFFAALSDFAIGYSIGSTFGSAVGVYLGGKSRHTTGSFGKALLGSIMGELIALGVSALTENSLVGFVTFLAAPPICAAIFFNSSLRYKSSPGQGNALLNFREGKMKIGIPYVQVQPYPLYVKNTHRTLKFNLNVMSVSF